MMILYLDVYPDQVLDGPGAFRRLLWKLAFWKDFVNLGWTVFQCYRCPFGILSLEIAPYGNSGIGSASGSGFGGPYVISASFGES